MIGHKNPVLCVYGSIVNSLAQDKDSDLDLTLIVDDFEISHELILRCVRSELEKNPRFDCSQSLRQLQSGVLLEVTDRLNRIEIDICVNKTMEVLNSQLVCAYGCFDVRFIKLALYIKAWNKLRHPDKMKRLNSFSIYLMLIAFLQMRGILPNLQARAPQPELTRYQLQHKNWDYVGVADTKFVRPDQFASLVDLPMFYETMNLGDGPVAPVKNEPCAEGPLRDTNPELISVGQLLLGFFEFYGFNFKHETLAIDIRHCTVGPCNRAASPSPFRLRQDFIDEAHRELQANADKNESSVPHALFY